MLDRCCVVCYNNHSLKMKGVLIMRVQNLIKKLQRYPIDAFVSIENDKLRIVEDTSCDCSPTYVSLEDIVSKNPNVSEQERSKVFEAVKLIHNTCIRTNKCSECVLSNEYDDCVLMLDMPDRWKLQTLKQHCTEE